MATTINDAHAKMTMIHILREGLERQIKDRLAKDIANEQVKIFRENIEPVIRAKVEQLVIEGINNVQQAMSLRDEIVVYCKWLDDEKT